MGWRAGWGVEESWVCLQRGGADGPCGRSRGRPGGWGKLRPTVRGWSGETTPRGAGGVCWAVAGAAAAIEEEKQPQPGPGEEKAAQAGGGGLAPWKDQVQQNPWGLSQDRLGRGGWPREGQGQHCWWPPPPPQGPSSPESPLQQRPQRWGWGYQTPELLPPSAELPEFSSSSGSLSPPL